MHSCSPHPWAQGTQLKRACQSQKWFTWVLPEMAGYNEGLGLHCTGCCSIGCCLSYRAGLASFHLLWVKNYYSFKETDASDFCYLCYQSLVPTDTVFSTNGSNLVSFQERKEGEQRRKWQNVHKSFSMFLFYSNRNMRRVNENTVGAWRSSGVHQNLLLMKWKIF